MSSDILFWSLLGASILTVLLVTGLLDAIFGKIFGKISSMSAPKISGDGTASMSIRDGESLKPALKPVRYEYFSGFRESRWKPARKIFRASNGDNIVIAPNGGMLKKSKNRIRIIV